MQRAGIAIANSEVKSPLLNANDGVMTTHSEEDELLFVVKNSVEASTGSDISFETIARVFDEVKVPALSVIFVFTVTIGMFPSIVVLIESTQKCRSSERFFNDLWTPFFFLLFNVFDLCGRMSAGIIKPLFTPKNIWMASLSRAVFIPLLLLCKLSSSRLATVFTNDAWPIGIMILFSVTNGYIASLCMMFGPSMVSPKDSMLAGTIMVFCLTFGLLCGASTSFFWLYVSQGSV